MSRASIKKKLSTSRKSIIALHLRIYWSMDGKGNVSINWIIFRCLRLRYINFYVLSQFSAESITSSSITIAKSAFIETANRFKKIYIRKGFKRESAMLTVWNKHLLKKTQLIERNDVKCEVLDLPAVLDFIGSQWVFVKLTKIGEFWLLKWRKELHCRWCNDETFSGNFSFAKNDCCGFLECFRIKKIKLVHKVTQNI